MVVVSQRYSSPAPDIDVADVTESVMKLQLIGVCRSLGDRLAERAVDAVVSERDHDHCMCWEDAAQLIRDGYYESSLAWDELARWFAFEDAASMLRCYEGA